MATASTDFMTATGLYGTSLQKVDVSDILSTVLLTAKGALSVIKLKGTAKDIEHKWIEESLNAVYVEGKTLSTVGALKLTITSPSTNAKVQKILRAGAIVYPENKEFFMRFTTPVTGANTVTFYGGSTSTSLTGYGAGFATCAAGTKFIVAAMPKADIASCSDDIAKARTIRKNYTQVFERGILIEETRKHIPLHAVGNELKHQTELRTKEIKDELDRSIIMGVPYFSAGYSPDIQSRTMAGLVHLLRDPDMDDRFEDTTVTQRAGPLRLTDINALVQKMYDVGGFPEDNDCCILVGAKQKRAIAKLQEEMIRKKTAERIVGVYADKVLSDMGFEIPVVMDRWIPPDKLIIVDKAAASLMPLQGDSWNLEKMGKTGRTEKWQLSGQFTIEIRNVDARHGMLYDLT